MSSMPAQPRWLKAEALGAPVGVDREHRIIRGYVMAQRGPFKTPGRGEFDDDALHKIVELTNADPKGLKSRFTHPTLSDDGLGKFLGRAKNARFDVDRVRGDLHLDPSSFATPAGDLGNYVLDLAESDSDALSSSLVLQIEREYRLEADGTRKKGEDGEDLPPLWKPTRLHASDLVDTGDAVDGLLSAGIDADELPDALVRRGAELLDRVFAGQPRDVIEARCGAWIERYLAMRFGAPTAAEWRPSAEDYERLRRLAGQSVAIATAPA